ncbi:MAG: mannitol dehydrogenase family protein [Pseudomonadota bacterium]
MTARTPLCAAQAEALAVRRVDGEAVDWPRYPRRIEKRICHLGVGGFHRAHQAFVLHQLLQQGVAAGWGLCGIGLRAADRAIHAALHAQDHLYSLWQVEGSQRRVTVVGSIMAHLDASEDAGPAIATLADAATRIVSLTITEAGYCLDGTGGLDASHADIIHDLAHPQQPRSAAGLLVAGLAARRAADGAGITLLSCDNLLANGERLRSAVLGFAECADPALALWIATQCSFPCSMVDRITPATDPVRRAAYCADWGVQDEALVMCEPWLQWVMEDHFVAGRPPYEQAGVQFSHEVARWEEAKVGLLNGGHSALAQLGLLRGHVGVHEALADPLVRQWHAGYMTEVADTLEPLDGLDYGDYQAALTRRFGNAALDDRLLRLAMDSSGKFPQVLTAPLCKRLDVGLAVPHLAMTIALWMHYLASAESSLAAYVDHDREGLIARAVEGCARGDASAFLARQLPLPTALATHFALAVNQQLHALKHDGLEAAIHALASH